jgi:hypothetical protein
MKRNFVRKGRLCKQYYNKKWRQLYDMYHSEEGRLCKQYYRQASIPDVTDL